MGHSPVPRPFGASLSDDGDIIVVCHNIAFSWSTANAARICMQVIHDCVAFRLMQWHRLSQSSGDDLASESACCPPVAKLRAVTQEPLRIANPFRHQSRPIAAKCHPALQARSSTPMKISPTARNWVTLIDSRRRKTPTPSVTTSEPPTISGLPTATSTPRP